MKTSVVKLETSVLEKLVVTRPHSKVLILFEDDFAGRQAMRLYESLLDHGSGKCSLETFCWDAQGAGLLECVVEALAMADIIVVAGNSEAEFPLEMQGALQVGFSVRRAEHGVLVTLLGYDDVDEPKPAALQISLGDLARLSGLDFVSGTYSASEEFNEYSRESIRQRSEFTTSTLERILHCESTSPHWGINE